MTTVPLTTLEKKRRLPFGIAGDGLNTIFVYLTIAGSVFTLFLDSVGLNKKQIGLILSLLPFMALMAPIVAPIAARVGVKRTFLAFYFTRKFVFIPLVAAPWIHSHYGSQTTFYYLVGVIGLFSICRAAAETAYYPWNQEYVPASIRGKYSAVDQIVATILAVATVAFASYVIGENAEPGDFVPLFCVALIAGFLSGVMFCFLPGGAPVRGEHSRGLARQGMRLALTDTRFIKFMFALTLTLIGAMVGGFLPLFMKNEVGLTPNVVVWLDTATMTASLISCFLWGWAIDRYGSKPVIVLTLALMVLYPTALLLIPIHSPLTKPIAFGAAAYIGLLNPGWGIAFGRHLFVEMVPEEHKTGYLAVYYAWMGLISGLAPLAAGLILQQGEHLTGTFGFLHLNAYTPLLLLNIVCLIAAAAMFSHVHAAMTMPVRQFAGMFIQGNPFTAMHSMVVHSLANDENSRIASIDRLGMTGSPLTIDELIDALNDPSFNVRHEAVVTMARMKPHDRIIDALLQVVHGPEMDLAIVATWALGRIGDKRAIPMLREQLLSNYPLLAARAARSLGQLHDEEVKDLILARFRDEMAPGMRIAYAATLGLLGDDRALTEILDFLREADHAAARRELSLAIARMVRSERYVLRLWRKVVRDPGTSLSEALLHLRKRLIRELNANRELIGKIDRAIGELADNELAQGIGNFLEVLGRLDVSTFQPVAATVLEHTRAAMSQFKETRVEYVVLTLHVLDSELAK